MSRTVNLSVSESEFMLWSPTNKDLSVKMRHLHEWYLNKVMVRRIHKLKVTGHHQLFDQEEYLRLTTQLGEFYTMGNELVRQARPNQHGSLQASQTNLNLRISQLEEECKTWRDMLSEEPDDLHDLGEGLGKEVLKMRWKFHNDTKLKAQITKLRLYLDAAANMEDLPGPSGQHLTQQAQRYARLEKGQIDHAFNQVVDKLDEIVSNDNPTFAKLSDDDKALARNVKRRLLADIECLSQDMIQHYNRRRRPSPRKRSFEPEAKEYDPWKIPYEER